jgi:hypothetical protein
MKAWEVIAVERDGELVCRDCCSDEEKAVWDDSNMNNDAEISVVFASDELEEDACCGRCGCKIEED